MNLLLTSCGLETKTIENAFLKMLPKPPSEIRAMFIPTAAVSPDAIECLPKCLNDLLKCGIARESISVCDLHDPIEEPLHETYDVIYLCGGNPEYLLRRINERDFRVKLTEFLNNGSVVIGVSAGSMIFAENMPNNLGALRCALDVHCGDEERVKAGRYPKDRRERIKLSNTQAILFENNEIVIFE